MAALGWSILALTVLLAISLPASAEENKADVAAAIRSVLVATGEAWNRGDLSGYMAGFARNERTRHIFNRDITVGHSAIEARFRARYPDPSDMGTISNSDLRFPCWLRMRPLPSHTGPSSATARPSPESLL